MSMEFFKVKTDCSPTPEKKPTETQTQQIIIKTQDRQTNKTHTKKSHYKNFKKGKKKTLEKI